MGGQCGTRLWVHIYFEILHLLTFSTSYNYILSPPGSTDLYRFLVAQHVDRFHRVIVFHIR